MKKLRIQQTTERKHPSVSKIFKEGGPNFHTLSEWKKAQGNLNFIVTTETQLVHG